MAKKKVIDAEIIDREISRLCARSFVSTPYFGYSNGNPSVDAMVRNMIEQEIQAVTTQLVHNINVGFSTMLWDLKIILETSAREEDGGMCGLCRVDDNPQMPVDYRPGIKIQNPT
jgi:hypothetical protein